MRGFLLDTNAVLFALNQPERLSAAARAAILEGANQISVISYWEVVLKCMKGKLKVGDPQIWWRNTLDSLSAAPLNLRPEHIARIYLLPPHHQDPFDRVLIAQAIEEELVLVSCDGTVPLYAEADLRFLT
jgi:PIN domain nuclease of toxin-antitoxin system